MGSTFLAIMGAEMKIRGILFASIMLSAVCVPAQAMETITIHGVGTLTKVYSRCITYMSEQCEVPEYKYHVGDVFEFKVNVEYRFYRINYKGDYVELYNTNYLMQMEDIYNYNYLTNI